MFAKKIKLSHIALIIKNLEDSEKFYSNIPSFEKIYRPNFKSKGLWYRAGDFYLHLILSETMTRPFIDPINQTAQTHFGANRKKVLVKYICKYYRIKVLKGLFTNDCKKRLKPVQIVYLNSLKNMEKKVAYRDTSAILVTRHSVQIEDLKSY